jgi:hypothetical protein
MIGILAKGSSGRVGSEFSEYFDRQGRRVISTNSNMHHPSSHTPSVKLRIRKQLKRVSQTFMSAKFDIHYRIEQVIRRNLNWRCPEEAYKSDQDCCISNLTRRRGHNSNWRITRALGNFLEVIMTTESVRPSAAKSI